MIFSNIWQKTQLKFSGRYEVLNNEQHIVRHCIADKMTGEIGMEAFELSDRDIEKAREKKQKPCISTQWFEYWENNLSKEIEALKKRKLKITERSRFSCLKVEVVKKIGKKYGMNLDVAHSGDGHAGIYNVSKNDTYGRYYQFKRDMMFEGRRNLLSKDN